MSEISVPINAPGQSKENKKNFGIQLLPDIAFLRQLSVQGRLRYNTASTANLSAFDLITITPPIGETLFVYKVQASFPANVVRADFFITNDGNTRELFSLNVSSGIYKSALQMDSLVGNGIKSFIVGWSNTAGVGTKTTVDNKLTHAAMLLSYMVEYGIDFKRRIISLTGEVDEFMYDILDFGMTEMESSSKKAITIKINSPGGSTYQAMAIVGRIRECTCQTITKGYGHVMSAATLILACGKKRKMSSYAFTMWHEASYDLSGRHSQIKADVKQVEKEEKMWAHWMAEFSKKDIKYWLENGVGIDA